MVRSLKDALDRINQLPQEQQEEFAAFILSELQAEERWAGLLSRSTDTLASMANEALEEHHRGETKSFESDSDLSHN
ncbi:MAG: hypothetical protein HS101_12450 [Planctomycetia bacterium]|jgi:hypothetical protein|nr:hypothetical protein [Planctomycetia bacterium]MCC7316354.1 hypothetical protein [Planctomycetota bacterium]OQZ05554.1 MAG: hypothetical protein B6D36_09540 [Planctomycetes bacterium UTPLA1]